MRIIVISLLILFSFELVSENQFQVLYLNSGSGITVLERSILQGVEETLFESNNISLYYEDLDLYRFPDSRNKLTLKNHLITKYSKMKIDLIIFINGRSYDFYETYLDTTVLTKHTLIVDLSSNDSPNFNFIDKRNNSITFNSRINDTITKINSIKNFSKVHIIKREWENIPELDFPAEIYNVDDIDFTITNKLIYLTSYSTDFIKKLYGNYIISSWNFSEVMGGYLADPKTFGNRIAYTTKIKMLGIDNKITHEEFKIDKLILDYKYISIVSDDIKENVTYINLPKNKFEENPTLIYRYVIITLVSLFILSIISGYIIYKVNFKRVFLESKEQLFNLINVLPLPIHARNGSGKYLFVNDSFLKNNKIKNRKDIINLSIHNTPGLSPEEIDIFLRQDREILEIKETKEYETAYYDPDKNEHKFYKTYKSPLKYYDEESVLCVIDDVSELTIAKNKLNELNKNLESKIQARTMDLEKSLEELQRTQNELIETKKMASLTTLVSGIAHEMNTPLGITLTQLTYQFDISREIYNEFKNNSLKKSHLENFLEQSVKSESVLINAIKRAIKMVNRFKEVAIQKGDIPENFNLKYFFTQHIELYLINQNIKNVNLKLLIPDNINIITYKDALTTIFENLIDNSLNHGFTEDGGEITIKASLDGSDISILYEDNGIGVKSDYLEKIFDPFYTTSRYKGQIGLGLSIVFATVKNKIDGNIDYYIPSNNKGLGFRIRVKDSKA